MAFFLSRWRFDLMKFGLALFSNNRGHICLYRSCTAALFRSVVLSILVCGIFDGLRGITSLYKLRPVFRVHLRHLLDELKLAHPTATSCYGEAE